MKGIKVAAWAFSITLVLLTGAMVFVILRGEDTRTIVKRVERDQETCFTAPKRCRQLVVEAQRRSATDRGSRPRPTGRSERRRSRRGGEIGRPQRPRQRDGDGVGGDEGATPGDGGSGGGDGSKPGGASDAPAASDGGLEIHIAPIDLPALPPIDLPDVELQPLPDVTLPELLPPQLALP